MNHFDHKRNNEIIKSNKVSENEKMNANWCFYYKNDLLYGKVLWHLKF